jgi:hypothetical protein
MSSTTLLVPHISSVNSPRTINRKPSIIRMEAMINDWTWPPGFRLKMKK